MKKYQKTMIFTSFMMIMIGLGASDALRGVFAPIFQSHFRLNTVQLSMIITISYVGNLLFLSLGGMVVDRYKRKNVAIGVMVLWMGALVLYLATDHYICLLVGMLFAMGASTLMNTIINLTTPLVFLATPGLVVNTLFFIQGIGTSGSQSLVGNFADGIGSWKIANGILLALGAVGTVLLFFSKVPEREDEYTDLDKAREAEKNRKKPGLKAVFGNPAFYYISVSFGLYFVAEHGILNWLVTYLQNALGMAASSASNYLAIFFGGMTLGRLLLAPVVQKLGAASSIKVFGTAGIALYVLGAAFGSRTVMLLSISGFLLSIIYPTMVLLIRRYYKIEVLATATGMIISAATLFDIAFNAVFGWISDILGLGRSFLILPVCGVLFLLCYYVFLKKVKPLPGVNI
ncbi:MFS transporter [Cuneatibacter caecimuris]|uniref:Fucose permease n=1 Tax=Cuneatibacter caecimuris TaxID=1796618 RepID=A0A4Q7PJX5_9FIRM|nr:MFS transporter [Cuneatibacter caecimuris]RZT01003.1 fucose permease [Cuneatibacter caecimuris]